MRKPQIDIAYHVWHWSPQYKACFDALIPIDPIGFLSSFIDFRSQHIQGWSHGICIVGRITSIKPHAEPDIDIFGQFGVHSDLTIHHDGRLAVKGHASSSMQQSERQKRTMTNMLDLSVM